MHSESLMLLRREVQTPGTKSRHNQAGHGPALLKNKVDGRANHGVQWTCQLL